MRKKYLYSISEILFSYKFNLENGKDSTILFKISAEYGMIGVIPDIKGSGTEGKEIVLSQKE